MSSINTFIPRGWNELSWFCAWESSPALPSWMTATTPANTTFTYTGINNQYELNIGSAAAVGTEVKVESQPLSSNNATRFEVDAWRHHNNAVNEFDTELYFKGASFGFSLFHEAASGVTKGQFIGSAAEDAVSIELVRNNTGGRVKFIGLQTDPLERVVHILVDGEIQRTFSVASWPNNQTDLRAGIRLIKRGGGSAQWMRWSGFRLAWER